MAVITGSIRADEVLTLPEFKNRTGFSKHSLRGLRESGLPIKRVGQRAFIVGQDFLEFMQRCPNDQRIATGAVPAGK